jgi:hypothetical protein
MRLRRLGGLAVLIGLLVSADAQAAREDSVLGTAWDCPAATGCGPDPAAGAYTFLDADARSRRAGRQPGGTVSWRERSLGTFDTSEAQVTCLSAIGRTAIIGVAGTTTISTVGVTLPIAGWIRVTDGGVAPGQDSFELDIQRAVPPGPPLPGPTDCSAFPAGRPVLHNDVGDLVVTEFSYVAGQACLLERVAHGVPAFSAKYGSGVKGRHAMRRCIRARLRTG